MTNENQIILWFPIKLYDKREPNYFVIPNKIIWQTRTKLFCNSAIKLHDKREPNYFDWFDWLMFNVNFRSIWAISWPKLFCDFSIKSWQTRTKSLSNFTVKLRIKEENNTIPSKQFQNKISKSKKDAKSIPQTHKNMTAQFSGGND
jgi:hypothetical protein